jgi:hypothetical protein
VNIEYVKDAWGRYTKSITSESTPEAVAVQVEMLLRREGVSSFGGTYGLIERMGERRGCRAG